MDNKKMSNKQENKVAKETGGYTTIASGALYFQKADVRLDNFLIECKTTREPFYKLKRSTWEKIQKEALKDGMRIPLMQVDLENSKYRVAIIDYNDFLSFDLDEYVYVRTKEEVTKKSTRIKKLEPYNLSPKTKSDITGTIVPFYIRKDIIFKDRKKKDLHLVILEWEDFLMLMSNKDDENE